MHLFHTVTLFVLALVQKLGYAGIFLGMFGQAVGVPLPSEVVLSFAGYLASAHALTLPAAIAAGTAGDMGGALLAYAIGYYGGRPFLLKYGRYVFVRHREIERAERWFARFGSRAVLICKLLPGIRAFGSFPAGMAEMPVGIFLGYTALGSIIWCIAFGSLGYTLGRNWDVLAVYLRPFSLILLAMLLAAVVLWIWSHFRAERSRA
ncbi:MAG: DedA family protein [Candidatus Eremiobacteraeota bacterium]|nr:DedA family protein [Candidatus Eremiobacteraeota bacterium]MBC5826089.1 DedA family protein [Candidatus Eremiobacteraeota bacterium]